MLRFKAELADGSVHEGTLYDGYYMKVNRALRKAGERPSAISVIEQHGLVVYRALQHMGVLPDEGAFPLDAAYDWAETADILVYDDEDAEGEAAATPAE